MEENNNHAQPEETNECEIATLTSESNHSEGKTNKTSGRDYGFNEIKIFAIICFNLAMGSMSGYIENTLLWRLGIFAAACLGNIAIVYYGSKQ